MKAVVCTLALGGWYPAGAARLIQTMREHSPGIEVHAHVNTLPFGAPANVLEDGYNYTAYCAKPFALAAAMMSGADIAILVDAAFYAVRDIHPLIDHIAQTGYYLCDNGNKVGEWCSDRAMTRMNENRDDLMQMTECSSYCVGLNFADGRCAELLHRWCGFASDRLTFAGPHTAPDRDGRNRGFVSVDPRVRGTRHDQTALSVLAYRLGMQKLSQRPRFTAYAESATDATVLANRGGL
jgi:hypothetical protein